MLMIVVLHYNSHSGALLIPGEPATGVQIFATLMESFCITGVNVYVFLSGYFLSASSTRPSRILKLLAQIYFYTVVISLAMIIVGSYVVHSGNSVFKIGQYLFPISSEHYWFATAYLIMYILSPIMNAAVNTLSKKQLKWSVIGLLVWFCFIKSIVPIMFSTDHYGYDFGWFICLYLIAAYIKKYDISFLDNAKKGAVVFAVSCLMIFVMSVGVHRFNLVTGRLNYYATVPTHFNFIFTLTGSLGLFTMLRFYRMKEGKAADIVRFVGPLTFGVYLLHMHLEIRDRWLVWMEHLLGEVPAENVLLFGWHLLRSVAIVFFAGIFVDWIRKIIFDFLGRVLYDTWLFKKIRQLDGDLC